MKFKIMMIISIGLILLSGININTIDIVTADTQKYEKETENNKNADKIQEDAEAINPSIIFYGSVLYRGGNIRNSNTMEFLKGIGVKVIILTDTNSSEIKLIEANRMNYINIDFQDNNMPARAELKKFLSLFKNGNTPLYISGTSGNFKGGILAAAHRIINEKWSIEKAEKEFRINDGDPEKYKKYFEFIINYRE